MDRSLNWKYIAAKAEGTSHTISKTPCQDSFEIGTIYLTEEKEIFYCFVSDGAGSALMGKRGAETACSIAVRFTSSLSLGENSTFTATIPYQIVEAISDELLIMAKNENLLRRDFACTFLGAIIFGNSTLYFQVGDGAIVIKESNDSLNYHVIFWPEQGEYANMTNFVTDENVVGNLKVKMTESVPSEISVFTDGLQRLCLNYDSLSVHNPFFKSMFQALLNCQSEEARNILNSKLALFLNSSSVNERTDDDKTLILAVHSS